LPSERSDLSGPEANFSLSLRSIFKQNAMNFKRILLISLFVLAPAAAWFFYNKYRVVVPAVDVARSEIGWSGKSVSDVHTGKISLKKAELQFQNDKLTGGFFEADMKSITVTDITDPEDNKHLVDHIANEDFFEVNRYPSASFRITEVKPAGNDLYEITGLMKIKDRENKLSFQARVLPAGESGRRATATISIDRTLFGIEYGSMGKPGSEKDWFIHNEFVLNVNVVTGPEK
jgi:polyisoprenoid-binding protein YceI